MHLAGQADGGDVARRRRRSAARTDADGRRPRRPTRARGSCSLQSGWGTSKPYSADADAADGARLVEQDRLGRRGRDVDAEDVAHRASAPVASRRSAAPRSTAQMCWLTTFSSSSWCPETRPRVDLAGRDPRREVGEDQRAVEDRRPERAAPAGVARLDASRRACRARPCRPRRAAPGRACRCPPMWAWNRSVRSMLWRRSLASKLKPPVVKPPAAQDLVEGQRELLDRVRELVGVPAVLGVAAVGVDAAEHPVRDRVGDLVVEAVAGERGVVGLDVERGTRRRGRGGPGSRGRSRRRSRTGAWSAPSAWAR